MKTQLVTLRLSKDIHEAAKEAALRDDRSLNSYIKRCIVTQLEQEFNELY